jgi:hypothetical protein
MLIVKVPAVVAVVLFLSSVSAQAMEFADRPGLNSARISSPAAIRALLTDDCSRRQINNRNVLLPPPVTWTKLADRPSSISNRIQIPVAQAIRPGRLSAEFSTIARGPGIKFEYGPGVASGWLKPTATRTAMKFEHRPGPISHRFITSAAGSIKVRDRDDFTSSLTKTTVLPRIERREGSAQSCIGSMAPCGSLSFVEHFTIGAQSAAYHEERL